MHYFTLVNTIMRRNFTQGNNRNGILAKKNTAKESSTCHTLKLLRDSLNSLSGRTRSRKKNSRVYKKTSTATRTLKLLADSLNSLSGRRHRKKILPKTTLSNYL